MRACVGAWRASSSCNTTSVWFHSRSIIQHTHEPWCTHRGLEIVNSLGILLVNWLSSQYQRGTGVATTDQLDCDFARCVWMHPRTQFAHHTLHTILANAVQSTLGGFSQLELVTLCLFQVLTYSAIPRGRGSFKTCVREHFDFSEF